MSDALPELTRLEMNVVTSESGARLLTVSFLVNTRQLLMEDFDAAAHDAALRHAHAAGHMPVGPFIITTEPAESAQLGKTCPLCQGTGWLFEQDENDCPDCDKGKIKPKGPMVRSLEDMQIDNAIMMGDLVQVRASVELGLSL